MNRQQSLLSNPGASDQSDAVLPVAEYRNSTSSAGFDLAFSSPTLKRCCGERTTGLGVSQEGQEQRPVDVLKALTGGVSRQRRFDTFLKKVYPMSGESASGRLRDPSPTS